MQHLHALATAEIIRIRLHIERCHCSIIIMLQLLRMYQENIGSTQWFLFWRWWHHVYNLFLCQHADYMKYLSFHGTMATTVSYPCWCDCQCQGYHFSYSLWNEPIGIQYPNCAPRSEAVDDDKCGLVLLCVYQWFAQRLAVLLPWHLTNMCHCPMQCQLVVLEWGHIL